MSHPHQSMLDEFTFAINHFVPTVPDEVVSRAKDTLKKLAENIDADEDTIKDAFHDIGILEFPHRRAYQELTMNKAGARLIELVLEHVDDTVRGFIKPHLDAGVSLNELVDSEIFVSELTPEQRYQVEDGILVSKSKLADELKDSVSLQSDEYAALVEKWTARAREIDKKISELVALGNETMGDRKQEILNKAQRFREGFLVTERDPNLKEIEKEIEYWKDSFASDEQL